MDNENLGLNENQMGDSAQDNDTQDTQTPQEQTTIQQQIQNLKKVLESLESQNEQDFNQALEIAKLQDVLLQIEQLRKEIFANAQEKLEESEAYFSLVGVKVAFFEKLKAQNEC